MDNDACLRTHGWLANDEAMAQNTVKAREPAHLNIGVTAEMDLEIVRIKAVSQVQGALNEQLGKTCCAQG